MVAIAPRTRSHVGGKVEHIFSYAILATGNLGLAAADRAIRATADKLKHNNERLLVVDPPTYPSPPPWDLHQ